MSFSPSRDHRMKPKENQSSECGALGLLEKPNRNIAVVLYYIVILKTLQVGYHKNYVRK